MTQLTALNLSGNLLKSGGMCTIFTASLSVPWIWMKPHWRARCYWHFILSSTLAKSWGTWCMWQCIGGTLSPLLQKQCWRKWSCCTCKKSILLLHQVGNLESFLQQHWWKYSNFTCRKPSKMYKSYTTLPWQKWTQQKQQKHKGTSKLAASWSPELLIMHFTIYLVLHQHDQFWLPITLAHLWSIIVFVRCSPLKLSDFYFPAPSHFDNVFQHPTLKYSLYTPPIIITHLAT